MAILVFVSFHAVLSVWFGSMLGAYDLIKAWKEFLLVVLSLVTVWIAWRDKKLQKELWEWPVFWMVVAYTGLHIALGVYALIIERTSLQSLVYSLVVNLRFLAFFICCAIFAVKAPWLRNRWSKIVYIPAVIVVGFGLLQAFVLPNDILYHIGYDAETIPAYHAVDQKTNYIRVQSTLRGPNPLGAYLVIVIAGVASVLLANKIINKKLLWGYASLLVAAFVVLGYTYSRSAYIGAILALLVCCWLTIRKSRAKHLITVGAVFFSVVGGVSIYTLRQNDQVQNIIFHTDEHSESPRSSNQDRLGALQAGIGDMLHEPSGRGPGTAGPASVYNGSNNVRISENYYLQIGQEVGWLGLVLLLAVVIWVGVLLVRLPDPPAVGLFASLVGISAINMLSHAWADDTLSMLWWGLAGLVIGPAILGRDEKR